jgi:hypothetical protein
MSDITFKIKAVPNATSCSQCKEMNTGDQLLIYLYGDGEEAGTIVICKECIDEAFDVLEDDDKHVH